MASALLQYGLFISSAASAVGTAAAYKLAMDCKHHVDESHDELLKPVLRLVDEATANFHLKADATLAALRAAIAEQEGRAQEALRAGITAQEERAQAALRTSMTTQRVDLNGLVEAQLEPLQQRMAQVLAHEHALDAEMDQLRTLSDALATAQAEWIRAHPTPMTFAGAASRSVSPPSSTFPPLNAKADRPTRQNAQPPPPRRALNAPRNGRS